MQATITLCCNWKKRTLVKVSGGTKIPLDGVLIPIPISLDDFVTRGKVGYEALHEKLAMFAQMHKFELKGLIEQLATTGLFRVAHCMRDHGVPRFVAKELFKMLVDARACVWEGAAIEKTSSYVMFLRNVVEMERTLASVHSGQSAKQRYVLPNDVDEMSVEMLSEELRVAEEIGAKETMIKKLRTMFHAKQKEIRETANVVKVKGRPDRPMTEIEHVRKLAREADTDTYDDVPQKKRRKR